MDLALIPKVIFGMYYLGMVQVQRNYNALILVQEVSYMMPDSSSQVTYCCFGGPDLDVLFISIACVNGDIKKEPNAGSVYAVKLGVKWCLEKR